MWQMEHQFVVDQLQSVFFTDSLDSSKPLSRHVESQAEIGTTGDTITYAKGASIVRMMDMTFGTAAFQLGLRNYLKSRYTFEQPGNMNYQ